MAATQNKTYRLTTDFTTRKDRIRRSPEADMLRTDKENEKWSMQIFCEYECWKGHLLWPDLSSKSIMLMSFAHDTGRLTFWPVFFRKSNWNNATIFPFSTPWKPALWPWFPQLLIPVRNDRLLTLLGCILNPFHIISSLGHVFRI